MPVTKSNSLRVVCAGLSYRVPGDENPTAFAMHGALIDLDATEEERLRKLGAVVGADEPDPEAVIVDGDSGTSALVSNEEHAKKARAEKK